MRWLSGGMAARRGAGSDIRPDVADGALGLAGAGRESLDEGTLGCGWIVVRIGVTGWAATAGGLGSVLRFVTVTGMVAWDCGRLF
ncbi:MAG: hypothetical protein NTY01_10990 [Verrucomicrobia bacterium]|nr:hypothetical protein [Verrucomicrobiota bacterium]